MPDHDLLTRIVNDRLADYGITCEMNRYGVHLQPPVITDGLLVVSVAGGDYPTTGGWVQVTHFPDVTHAAHTAVEFDDITPAQLDEVVQLVESHMPAGWWLDLPAHDCTTNHKETTR